MFSQEKNSLKNRLNRIYANEIYIKINKSNNPLIKYCI